MGDTCADQLAAGDPRDSSPSAAAPAAGGRGIDGSRRVHSLGVRGLLVGGAVVVEARPEKLLEAAVLSSVLGAPVEALGRSAASGASAALRSRGVLPLEPASVVAAAALVLGVLLPSPTCGVVLLLKIAGSLQAGCSPSSADSVGSVEDGWSLRLRLRCEAATVVWWRLGADARSASRFRRLRRMASAASQQGWSSWLLRCEVSSSPSFPAACCWWSKVACCLVVPCSPCLVWLLPLFVRVCSCSV